MRPRGQPELPQEVAPLAAEAVARAAFDERFELVAGERGSAGEIADVEERPIRGALGDESLRFVVPDGRDVRDPDPHGPPRASWLRATRLDRALRPAQVDIGRQHLHPAPLRVATSDAGG